TIMPASTARCPHPRLRARLPPRACEAHAPLSGKAWCLAVLKLQSVKKVYKLGENTVHALRGVSLDIEAGEFVSIIGPSGSGKSTMMHILGCLDRPSEGHYLLSGKDVSSLSRDELAEIRNKQIGFVFQGF